MKVKKILVLVSAILICLILLEIGLRVLSAFLIYSPKNSQVYDDRLGRRIDPSQPEIDENGFRNPSVPGAADIAVLGDSHTYGEREVEKSWPGSSPACRHPSTTSASGVRHSSILLFVRHGGRIKT
jgi:hypothetical protein